MNPLNEKHFNQEDQKIWNLAGSYQYDASQTNEEAWKALQHQLKHREAPKTLKIWRKTSFWAAAASIALIVSISVYYLQSSKQMLQPQAIFATAMGEIKTVTLEDGSTIKLNSGSSIVVKEGYAQTSRSIELNGEAFFEVAKNKDLPFIVKAGNTTTTVLGTAFDINTKLSGNAVSIQVVRGKVSFAHAKESMTLIKNTAAIATASGITFLESDTSMVSWTKGKLEFSAHSLEHINNMVKNSYGKGLVFDPKFKDKTFTGTFDVGTPVNEIAEIISAALQIPISVENP